MTDISSPSCMTTKRSHTDLGLPIWQAKLHDNFVLLFYYQTVLSNGVTDKYPELT
jgi:hypothetical protein